jgi:hypothetical protein
MTPPPPHPADLNGLVRFAERRNLVSARVPSHFKRSLALADFLFLEMLTHQPGGQQQDRRLYATVRPARAEQEETAASNTRFT